MINEKVKLGKLEINLDELAEFIVRGKKRGFAGGGEYKEQEDGSKVFTFPEPPLGDFYYTDRYWGSTQAPGYELVRWKDGNGQGLWYMSYCGGMLPEFQGDKKLAEKTFEFLRKSLSRVTSERPFRGEHIYDAGDFLYLDDHSEEYDIKKFKGVERIWFKDFGQNIPIFSQDYIGGLIIP